MLVASINLEIVLSISLSFGIIVFSALPLLPDYKDSLTDMGTIYEAHSMFINFVCTLFYAAHYLRKDNFERRIYK
jgi:hypothetical protein